MFFASDLISKSRPGLLGTGQAVKQVLQRETHQQHVVIIAGFRRALGQTGMN